MNKFNAGLITDASPLTTPDNSSLEEDNFVLNIDGSRNRRLGMDYELDYSHINTTIDNASSTNVAISSYRWDNAGGNPEVSLLAVQFGNQLRFFKMDQNAVSKGLFHTETFSSDVSSKFSYAVVDGILVVVNGDKQIYNMVYQAPSTIIRTSNRLKIRDLFGVEDRIGGVDITSGDAVQNRPTTNTGNHVYNIRNQTFGIPRINQNAESLGDPIDIFRQQSGNKFPSNSDNLIAALYNDAEDADNRTVDRFFSADLVKNPLGTTRAPMGYFIIDALDRGESRLANELANRNRYPELGWPVLSLPTDMTPIGATVISEFAGRVFYGGFSGEVIDGDSKSPRLSSYILFSKVVQTPDDINLCYQEGDPTSKDNADLVATDGGFIRLNGAYGVKALINLGSSLMVVAANGVWRIVGGSDVGFTATAYIVEKITDRGCTAPDSIAQIDSSFMFWSDDAIYHVTTDQFGSWTCNNISFSRIQNFYDAINIESKRFSVGAYDSYERKVRWIYNNYTTNTSEVKELVLDLQLQAYYTNTINNINGAYPKVVSIYKGLPYSISTTEVSVVAGIEEVVIGSEAVVIGVEERSGVSQRELGYITMTQADPTAIFTFSKYRNNEFRDWFSYDGSGVDAAAYMVTSYLSGTDFQRDKQVNFITIHLRRTETGYTDDMNPINPSSCLVQSRWGWSDSDNSGKWGREFQAYRYRILHLPVDSTDDYDNGFSTVVSRNKLRGTGKVLSLRFRTEPFKNLHLYGWSMIFSVSENV